jgi:hypothetical protein
MTTVDDKTPEEQRIDKAVRKEIDNCMNTFDLGEVQRLYDAMGWKSYSFDIGSRKSIKDFCEELIDKTCREAIKHKITISMRVGSIHVICTYGDEDIDEDTGLDNGPWIGCKIIAGFSSLPEDGTLLFPKEEKKGYTIDEFIIERQQQIIRELEEEVKSLRVSLHKSGGGGNYEVRTKTY